MYARGSTWYLCQSRDDRRYVNRSSTGGPANDLSIKIVERMVDLPRRRQSSGGRIEVFAEPETGLNEARAARGPALSPARWRHVDVPA